MRIAIFGASGGVGQEVVMQALLQQHHVQALVRNAARAPVASSDLVVTIGDVLDAAIVDRVVRGADAVICALGARPADQLDTCSSGTSNIVEAMRRHGVKRLACVTGCMVGHPHALMKGWFYKLFRWLEFGRLKKMMQDRRQQEKFIMESALDWTIVRPPRLRDGPRTGRYAAGADLVIGMSATINRADVADCLLKAVCEGRYVGMALAVDSTQPATC
jgi:putative NADH-flavin reductase